jgi:hypothetical protein
MQRTLENDKLKTSKAKKFLEASKKKGDSAKVAVLEAELAAMMYAICVPIHDIQLLLHN